MDLEYVQPNSSFISNNRDDEWIRIHLKQNENIDKLIHQFNEELMKLGKNYNQEYFH